MVWLVWLKFLLSFLIILFAGSKLARYGDAIAEKTGFGRLWIGLVLLALITSMPEFITGVSAVALVKPPEPDLALGTLLGSCLFNLTILAVLDVMYRPAPLLNKASSWHMLSAGLGILLMALAAGAILTGGWFSGLAVGWVGIPSFIIVIIYLAGVRGMFRLERGQQLSLPEATALRYGDSSMGTVWFRFALAAVAVIGAGVWLSFIGDEIAETTGWGTSFVGSIFLAIGTSMPELVVAIAALRLGAVDMAVADILGANMLDVAHIFTVDVFYARGPVLSAVSSSHLITAAVVVVMSLVVIAGLRFRQRRKTFIVISWYSLALIGLYILGAYALFTSAVG